jgi:hypothetical protein
VLRVRVGEEDGAYFVLTLRRPRSCVYVKRRDACSALLRLGAENTCARDAGALAAAVVPRSPCARLRLRRATSLLAFVDSPLSFDLDVDASALLPPSAVLHLRKLCAHAP